MRIIPHYKNILQERANARAAHFLPEAISNEKILSRKYKDIDLGFESDYEDDTRSNSELLADSHYMQAQLRPKFLQLFGKHSANDIEQLSSFLQQKKVTVPQFNEVYPDLLKMGRPITAQHVISKMVLLLKNLKATGSTKIAAPAAVQQAQQSKLNDVPIMELHASLIDARILIEKSNTIEKKKLTDSIDIINHSLFSRDSHSIKYKLAIELSKGIDYIMEAPITDSKKISSIDHILTKVNINTPLNLSSADDEQENKHIAPSPQTKSGNRNKNKRK